MLNDINKWKTLTKLKSYAPVIINDKIVKTHHNTIRKNLLNEIMMAYLN